MLIPLERARQIYEALKAKFAKQKSGKILIYVSLTVDSLSSLRILVSLLQNDLIPYEIIPVQNFNELESKAKEKPANNSSIYGIKSTKGKSEPP